MSSSSTPQESMDVDGEGSVPQVPPAHHQEALPNSKYIFSVVNGFFDTHEKDVLAHLAPFQLPSSPRYATDCCDSRTFATRTYAPSRRSSSRWGTCARCTLALKEGSRDWRARWDASWTARWTSPTQSTQRHQHPSQRAQALAKTTPDHRSVGRHKCTISRSSPHAIRRPRQRRSGWVSQAIMLDPNHKIRSFCNETQ